MPPRLPARIAGCVDRRPWAAAAGLVAVAALAGLIGLSLLAPAAPASATASAAAGGSGATATWTLTQLVDHARAGDVASIASDPQSSNGLVAITRDGGRVVVTLSVPASDAVQTLATLGFGSLLTVDAASLPGAALSGGPVDTGPATLLLVGLLVAGLAVMVTLAVHRSMRGSARREGARATFTTVVPTAGREDAARGVRLEDVAGCDEAKLELVETIEFLRDPARFHRLGATSPRGVLLWGPPGTGKTMLARAVATEAGVPFIASSGSQFVEKFVGVGASRVRDLFAQARRHGRAVLFIDEFDALAKTRGGINSHEEREQTLNQLLVEMDGFATTDQVVVIAATNRHDTLDPAVLRPGRFTRKIHVGLPDVAARRAILASHARNKPLDAEVDLEGLARRSAGFSGAELADVLNEAAILAARRDGEVLSPADVRDGWLKVAVGTSRVRSMDERERAIIAAHEAGHAVCGRVWGEKRRVEEISLFAHGEALGVTVSSREDNDLPSESDLRATLVALMGGRAAEELLFEEVTAGASNDFEKADRLATRMVTRWGMGTDPEAADAGVSGRGPISFRVAQEGSTLPADVSAAMGRAIAAILDDAYAAARRTLLRELPRLRRVSAYLVEHERIDGETFAAVYEGRLLPSDAADWRPSAARPRAWDEVGASPAARTTSPAPPAEPPPAAEPAPPAVPPGLRARPRAARRLPGIAWAPAALLRRVQRSTRPDPGT